MGYGNTETFSTRHAPSNSLPNGLYLLKGLTPANDPDGVYIPMVSLDGKIYSLKIDQEMSVDGFGPGSRLLGPMQ